MRLRRTVAPVAVIAAAAACSRGQSAPLATLQDSASYAVGQNMGSSLREVRDEVNVEQVVQGLRDAVEGREGRLTPQDAQRVLAAYGQEVQSRQTERREAVSDSNRVAGDAYRAENGGREGVTTTASGLQYEVLTEGTGPKPTATSTVRVHYVGTLVDGKQFDSSREGGEPVTFNLGEVIPGWSEAVRLMSVGSRYRFVLPPEIGYGAQGSPPDIGPHATLIFDVELLEILN
jgi:FKBP-type peptidyl-prolyl cis-trans isomerase FkpA/FKBP-type peptidyl-prolyl cis-trans isomerase FklB